MVAEVEFWYIGKQFKAGNTGGLVFWLQVVQAEVQELLRMVKSKFNKAVEWWSRSANSITGSSVTYAWRRWWWL
jgi:hypothetical protein